jgi:hypothetical protein
MTAHSADRSARESADSEWRGSSIVRGYRMLKLLMQMTPISHRLPEMIQYTLEAPARENHALL